MTLKDQVLDTLSKLPTLTNKELYALYPNDDQGSIRNYKHLYLKSITKEESEEVVIIKTPPGKKKVAASKKTNHDPRLDKELIAMEDSELIRHTCRKIIATKDNDPRLKLQASNLLLSFADKTGDIRSFVPSEEAKWDKKFKSMTVKDLVAIVSSGNSNQRIKGDYEAFNMKSLVATAKGVDESEIETQENTDYTTRDHTTRSRDKQLARADDGLFKTEEDT